MMMEATTKEAKPWTTPQSASKAPKQRLKGACDANSAIVARPQSLGFHPENMLEGREEELTGWPLQKGRQHSQASQSLACKRANNFRHNSRSLHIDGSWHNSSLKMVAGIISFFFNFPYFWILCTAFRLRNRPLVKMCTHWTMLLIYISSVILCVINFQFD